MHDLSRIPEFSQVIAAALDDANTGWSMGSFGAIAEFHHVRGDPPALSPDGGVRITARGGIAFTDLTACRPVAYETLSPKADRWGQSVALCLPAELAGMNARQRLTALGPDHAALREADRGALLFDMGLGQPQVDFCIRTSDQDLIAVLSSVEGRSLFEPGNPAMAAILRAHPHRVALTRLGRVEVYQKIGGPDTGGKSPVGPHTHILPKLMATGRTHSANTPIPQGLVPVGGLHPASPFSDPVGREKPWDAAAFNAFQQVYQNWASDDMWSLKTQVRNLIAAGTAPEDFDLPPERHMRAALRIAIRQAVREDGDTPATAAWRTAFDRPSNTADVDPEHPE